ncbi:hypothetical protein ACFL5Z_08575 [Planctomycetota bacterium]
MDSLADAVNGYISKHNFVHSINIVGSYLQRAQCNEIDFYIIVDKLTPNKLRTLSEVFQQISKLYGSPYLEFRRGPFKMDNTKQLHVIIDDMESIYETSPITLTDWALNSLNIYGKPVNRLLLPKQKEVLVKSFRDELYKTLGMIVGARIDYREWSYHEGGLCLKNKTKKIGTIREFQVLLKYGYTAMKNDFLALNNVKSFEGIRFSDIEGEIEEIARGIKYSQKADTGRLRYCVKYFIENLLKLPCSNSCFHTVSGMLK